MSCRHNLDICPECGPGPITPPLPEDTRRRLTAFARECIVNSGGDPDALPAAAPTPPLPTSTDLQETAYDPSDDRCHTEATRVGLRHTEWRRAPWGRRNEGQGVEPW